MYLSTITQPHDWHTSSKQQKFISIVGAYTFTFLIFTLFIQNSYRSTATVEATHHVNRMQFSWIKPKTHQPQTTMTVPNQISLREKNKSHSVSIKKSVKTAIASSVENNTITTITPSNNPSINTQPVTDPNSNAPQRLQFDSATIRRAYEDSKSDIQKMAEASGKPLHPPHASKYDQFQTAASQAAKKDCLGPNAGGSLLSIFVIPFMAATDKCK
jgi:hypothetical protein